MAGDVIVKKSKIHGLGVFANRDFKKGEIVLKWDLSHELSTEEVKELDEEEKKHISYQKGKYILMQPPERYVNHSCDANTFTGNFCDVAKRDVRKGEEITTNYTEGGSPGQNIKCNCGSKKCKGIIKT